SGHLRFMGIEYAFKSDDSFLRRFPHMGDSTELEPGDYRAEFFEFGYPRDFHEDLLRQKLPFSQFRVHQFMNTLAPAGCLSILALLASIAILDWSTWISTALPCGLTLIALPLILSRLPAYRHADRVYKDVQRQYPGYGVVLQPLALR